MAAGYGLGTAGQLVRCLRIAYGSCLELDTHLWIARRAGALPSGRHTARAVADVARIARLLVRLLTHYGARVGS
jgi:four helix bundle protein